ncbi:hypothetical protein TorRG33x02_243050, partial [Trema orientale]
TPSLLGHKSIWNCAAATWTAQTAPSRDTTANSGTNVLTRVSPNQPPRGPHLRKGLTLGNTSKPQVLVFNLRPLGLS